MYRVANIYCACFQYLLRWAINNPPSCERLCSLDANVITPASTMNILNKSVNYSSTRNIPVSFTVNENTPKGTKIGRLHDMIYPTPNSDIKFTIPRNSFFDIMIDGYIKIIGDLDRDNDRQLCMEPVFPKYCIWTSFAVSTGGLYAGIQITVNDLNDNIPTWHESTIILRFTEESQDIIKTELPVANDPDLDLNGIQDYRLKGNGRYMDTFKLEVIKDSYSSGPSLEDFGPKFRLYLEVVGPLDRETEASYNLTILAYDGAQPYHTGTLQILIEVLDENDHAPQFVGQSYVATVSEDVVVGTEVQLIGLNSTDNQADSAADYSPSASTRISMRTNRLIATDRDAGANGRVEYNFAPSTDPNVFYTFHLDKHTGVIRVAQPLSFDTGPREWSFHVLATDLGRPARSSSTMVKIQLNDANTHGPEIKMRIQSPKVYADSIEQAKKAGLISTLDPQVLYIPENFPPIAEPLVLFTVSDKDTGPGGIFRCYIDEAHTPESVSHVTSSQTLSQSSLAGHFELNFTTTLPNWKVYSLFVLCPIDREATEKNDLVITCEDQGYPPRKSFVHLTVFLIDENDNAPKFTQNHYRIHILEGNRPNISAGKVVAVDTDDGENGRVTYKIEWPSEAKLKANNKNGWLWVDNHGKLIVSQTLDREESPNGFQFKVIAVDNGIPVRLNSTADVELIVDDLNDCTPTFTESQYNFTIPEDFGQNFVSERYVGTVKAVDCDLGMNAEVTYSILDPGLPFAITGGGILKTTRLVDREVRSTYHLTVLATDGAVGIVTVGDQDRHTRSVNKRPTSKRVTQMEHKVRTSAAQVWITVVDVNDHHPVFVHPNSSHYQILVSVHEEKNFLLTRMVAIDKDNGANGHVRYKLSNQSPSELFEVYGETGELYIKNRMDSSHLGTLTLIIEASDQGIPPQSDNVTLEIKIVDTSPTASTKQMGQILSLIGLDDMGPDDAGRTGTIEVNKLIIMCIVISTTIICFIMVLSIALFVRRNPCCRSILSPQSQTHISQTDQYNVRWGESKEDEQKRLPEEDTELKTQNVAHGTKASTTVCVCSYDPTILNRHAKFLRFNSSNRQLHNGSFGRLQTDPCDCHFAEPNRMLCEVSGSPAFTAKNAVGQLTAKAGQVTTDLAGSFNLNEMSQRLCAFYDTSSTNVRLVALPLYDAQTDSCMNSITPLAHCGTPIFASPLQTNSHFVQSVMESEQEKSIPNIMRPTVSNTIMVINDNSLTRIYPSSSHQNLSQTVEIPLQYLSEKVNLISADDSVHVSSQMSSTKSPTSVANSTKKGLFIPIASLEDSTVPLTVHSHPANICAEKEFDTFLKPQCTETFSVEDFVEQHSDITKPTSKYLSNSRPDNGPWRLVDLPAVKSSGKYQEC